MKLAFLALTSFALATGVESRQFRLINSNLEIEKDSNLRGRGRQLPGRGKKLGLLIAKKNAPWAGEPGEGNPDGSSSEDEHTMEPTTIDSLDIDTSEESEDTERYLV